MENKQMQASELNGTVTHEYRTEVGDFVQFIGMSAEGDVLYTREEYVMRVSTSTEEIEHPQEGSL
ncbi:MAG: hypothetical protein CND85_01485 [Marine Group II euryarchaeote MED-G33]|nr:MAG: hypothetical protein CND85_01485 [Marine Group II euryarchaeote MED-G33]